MRRLMELLLLSCWLGVPGAALAGPGAGSAVPVEVPVESAMAVPDGLRRAWDAYRGGNRRLTAAQRAQQLVDFMVAGDGLALRYQEHPTYGVADSYASRRANCLSFTMMYIALARASGLDAYAQATDKALEVTQRGNLVARATHVTAVVLIDGREYTVDIGWRTLVARGRTRRLDDAETVALLYNNNAVEGLLANDLGLASREIQLARALAPRNPAILSNAGLIDYRSGRPDAAERAYLAALGIDPWHIGALGNLVGLYRDRGADAQRRTYEKRLGRAQSRDPFSQYLLGQAALGAGDERAAIRHYRRAILLMSREPLFHQALAEAYRQVGEAALSRKAFERARALEGKRALQRRLEQAGAPARVVPVA